MGVEYRDSCSRCGLPTYCSPDCARLDWFASHRFICPSSNSLSLEDFSQASSKMLGKGASGKTYLVEHKKSGRQFALKKVAKIPNTLAQALREIDGTPLPGLVSGRCGVVESFHSAASVGAAVDLLVK